MSSYHAITVLGKYQAYVPDEFLTPERTRIMLRQDRIIRWREPCPYIPPNCIQLPPEIIYMIAKLAPMDFVFVSHEYFMEFYCDALVMWDQIKLQRAIDEIDRLHKAFMESRFSPRPYTNGGMYNSWNQMTNNHGDQNERDMFIPLEFWFNREPRLAIPFAIMPVMQHYTDPTAGLRYAT